MTKLSENLPIEEARERLRQLIIELAVVRGHVVLASGKEADYYVDLRRITLHHEASRLVGQVMLDLLDKNGIEFEAAGGLTMGADPVGTAIMRAAGDQDRAIDAFVVRKAQKSYAGAGTDPYPQKRKRGRPQWHQKHHRQSWHQIGRAHV